MVGRNSTMRADIRGAVLVLIVCLPENVKGRGTYNDEASNRYQIPEEVFFAAKSRIRHL